MAGRRQPIRGVGRAVAAWADAGRLGPVEGALFEGLIGVDLAGGGGAGDPVVAAGVVRADRAGLVPGQPGCLPVVRGNVLCGGAGREHAGLQQRRGRGGGSPLGCRWR